MAKARGKPEVAAPRRGHAPLKYKQDLADAFGITPAVDAPEAPRETVKVDFLPDPPGTEIVEAAQSARRHTRSTEKVNIDEAVMNILREEAEEIRIRLERFGVAFNPQMQQDLVDHVYSMLAMNGQGIQVGGGALARR